MPHRRKVLQIENRLLQIDQGLLGRVKKAGPRTGEFDHARVAVEQLHADDAFQFLDEAAQRRLRDVHALRRLGELPSLREQDEGAELAGIECLHKMDG